MYGLILSIIGIAIFSVFMAAGSNYVDTDRLESQKKRAVLQSALSEYASGVVQFSVLFGKNPVSVGEVSPALVDAPALTSGTVVEQFSTYSVPSVGQRFGICLSFSQVPLSTYMAASGLKGDMGGSRIKITSSCSSLDEISAPLAYPASFNLIYLIKA